MPRRWLITALLTCLAGLLLGGGVIAAGWAYFHPRVDWRQGVVYGTRLKDGPVNGTSAPVFGLMSDS